MKLSGLKNSVIDPPQLERGECVQRDSFDAYPCKNQKENSSNRMIETRIFLKYQLPQ